MPGLVAALGMTIAALAAGAPAHASDPAVMLFTEGLKPASELSGIAVGSDGRVWFTDRGTSAIGRIDPATNKIEEFSAGLNAGSLPSKIAAGREGDMWFTDDGTTKAIGRIDPKTHRIEEFGAGLKPGALPGGITAGPEGNMWFTDQGAKALGRVTPGGAIDEFSLWDEAAPQLIALAPEGNLWFAGGTSGWGTEMLGRLDPAVIALQQWSESPPYAIAGLAAGPRGDVWYSDQGFTRAVVALNPGAHEMVGFRTESFTEGLNQYSLPADVAVGSEGDVWFVDQGATKAIGRLDPSTNRIEEFSVRFTPALVAAGPGANIWFTAGSAIGRLSLAPAISSLEIEPRKLVPARGGGPVVLAPASRLPQRGALVSDTDAAAAVVAFSVQRAVRGYRIGRSCTMRPTRTRPAGRCTVYLAAGRFEHDDQPGRNLFLFTARVGGHRLRPGSYRLTALPSNAAGVGSAAHVNFRVVN